MNVTICLMYRIPFFFHLLYIYIYLIPLNGIEEEEKKMRESNSVLVYMCDRQ